MLIIFLIMCLLVGAEQPKLFISALALCCALSYICVQYLPPAYDHGFYISRAMVYTSWSHAFFDYELNSTPVSSFIYVFSWFLNGSFNGAVVALNGLSLATCAVALMSSYPNAKSLAGLGFVSLATSLMLSPTLINIMANANKDLPLMACIAVALVASQKCLSPGQPRKFAFFALLLLAVINAFAIRRYFAHIMFASLSLVLIWLAMLKLNLSRAVSRCALGVIAYLLVSFLLLTRWNEIRSAVSAYEGRAGIYSLLSAERPDMLSALYYPLKGLQSFFLGLPASFFESSRINLMLILGGSIELLVFLLSLIIMGFSRQNRIFKAIFFVLTFIHLGLQVWSSPNFGALLRLRVVEHFCCMFIVSRFVISSTVKMDRDRKRTAIRLENSQNVNVLHESPELVCRIDA